MATQELSRKVGEFVVYKKHGIYEISEIRREKIASEIKTYYILKSVYDKNATVYVPTDNEELVNKMENVLTKQEIDLIIEKGIRERMERIENSAERFCVLEEIITKGDLSLILSMMLMLADRKEEALRTKAKTFAHDERMLTASQRIISEAFAFPLGIDRKEVAGYINERM